MGVGVTGKDGTNTLEAPPRGGGTKTPEVPLGEGGQDGTNTVEASAGGGDKQPGATPLSHPHTGYESCRGKGEEG